MVSLNGWNVKYNYKLRRIITILGFFFLFTEIFAQSHTFHHYTVEDGLPSSEVYSAFQDSKGYMWFATDAGVSRFNGYEFENFDANDGLTDNTVFLITEDYKGRIWFGTFNGKLCYFYNDSIYPYKYNKALSSKIIEKRPMCSFEVDSNETVWIGFFTQGLFKCDKKGNVNQVTKKEKECDPLLKVVLAKNHVIFGSTDVSDKTKLLISQGVVQQCQFCIEANKDDIVFNKGLLFLNDFSHDISNLFVNKYLNDVIIIHSLQSMRINFSANKSKASIINVPDVLIKKNRLYSVYSDDGYLWFCVNKKGVYKCILDNNRIVIIDHYFKGKSISRVYRDRENGLWFQSLDDGIYYVPSELFKNIVVGNRSEKKISSVTIDSLGKNIFTLTEDGKVYQTGYEKDGFPCRLIFQSQFRNYPLYFDYDNNELLLGKMWKGVTFFKSDRIGIKKCSAYNTGFKSIIVHSDTIYKVNYMGFSIMIDGQEKYFSYPEHEKMWCTSLIKDGANIWIGTNDGIRIYSDQKITNPYSTNKYLSTSITDMTRFSKDIFFVGTKSYGILVIQKDSIMDIINEEDGLVGNLVRKIYVDNEKNIWVGTNKGLSRINYRGKDKYRLYNLTRKHGLISGEVLDLCSDKKILFVATTNGLVQFDKTKIMINKTPPPIYITQFEVNSEKRDIQEESELSYQENFINIYFEGVNYRSLGEIEYQYRMLGIDTNWVSTTSRSVQYPTLQPNNYQFEVKAKNEDGYWSKPSVITFTIKPPFWLTWWFIMLEVVMGLLIIAIVFKYREKQIKNKSLVQKRMVELELRALRSQMNPHFIFNTLNSIQHFMSENDFKNTNKYLTQFAKLIRTVLNLSEKNMITIQEELDMLTLYLDLEEIRFEEEFDYEINVDEEIDKDYDEIPSMLIQPYIENAIWHGLMNKDKRGAIKIDIAIEENYLRCSIEDNGIGRKRAAEIKAKRNIKQKSVGMSITKERLDILNNKKINVEIIDLKDDLGKAEGTKVIIRIPYKIE